MDSKQIDFIICANNAQYYAECVRYIQNLSVPDTYNTDIICIQDALSMAQGYNAGMRASQAKYKVYLHQDTFIINQNFLFDLLRIFESDENIGMVGVLGGSRLPANADCCFQWDTGKVLAYDGIKVLDLRYGQNPEYSYVPVQAIDGLIMATQVDLPWREDILDGWDFYDVSQSLEMLRQGYQVVVPSQQEPWCHHDCGASKMENYDFYRQKVIREYPEYFKKEAHDTAAIQEKQKQIQEIARIHTSMIQLIEAGMYEELCGITGKIRGLLIRDTAIREIINLMEIYTLEKENNEFSGWWQSKNWEQLNEQYQYVRFLLLRARFRQDWEEELNGLLIHKKVTKEAVSVISRKAFGQ